MPNARMHIHSSNPVNTRHFCDQFLPRDAARHLLEIGCALKLSTRMPNSIAHFITHALPQS
jgi:hypothetical protein